MTGGRAKIAKRDHARRLVPGVISQEEMDQLVFSVKAYDKQLAQQRRNHQGGGGDVGETLEQEDLRRGEKRRRDDVGNLEEPALNEGRAEVGVEDPALKQRFTVDGMKPGPSSRKVSDTECPLCFIITQNIHR